MEPNLQLVLAQVTALRDFVEKNYPDSNLVQTLNVAIDDVNALGRVPDGFTHEQYDNFLAEQLPEHFGPDARPRRQANIADVERNYQDMQFREGEVTVRHDEHGNQVIDLDEGALNRVFDAQDRLRGNLAARFDNQDMMMDADDYYEDAVEGGADPFERNIRREDILDVVGTQIDEAGNVREVGNIEASAARANEMVQAFAEDDDDEEGMGGRALPAVNMFSITYTNLDGAALSEADVHTILSHPMSEPLKHLGNCQLVDVAQGDNETVQSANFAILEEGILSLQTLALGVVGYRGVHVFPGIGRVRAQGSVNYA